MIKDNFVYPEVTNFDRNGYLVLRYNEKVDPDVFYEFSQTFDQLSQGTNKRRMNPIKTDANQQSEISNTEASDLSKL